MNRYVAALVIFLLLIPVVLITYRLTVLDYPVILKSSEPVWNLSLEAQAGDKAEETHIMIGLPSHKNGLTVLEEKISADPLDFRLALDGRNRYGIWSGRGKHEGSPITYHSVVIVKPLQRETLTPKTAGPYPEGTTAEDRAVTDRLVAGIKALPPTARLTTVASALAGGWQPSIKESADMVNWTIIQNKIGPLKSALLLLRSAGFIAHAVQGLPPDNTIISEPIIWIEIWTDEGWRILSPDSWTVHPKSYYPIPLIKGLLPVVRPLKGEISDIRWSLSRQVISQWNLQYYRVKQSDRLLDRWSLFHLPTEFQATFRILILVPLGALMVCLLRNVIGFPTFGIFMPVLMALAFRNTGLLYGLGIFAAVLAIGYGLRFSIDRLRLLLVPRLSVILTLVIAFFIFFALLGNKLGLREFMAIGLLPFVILTMTIERFHVIMEEQGLKEALQTAAGSTAVATITYAIIQFEPLQLAFFVYPELLSVVMAGQVLLGRYTGYRLMELIRFKNLRTGHGQ